MDFARILTRPRLTLCHGQIAARRTVKDSADRTQSANGHIPSPSQGPGPISPQHVLGQPPCGFPMESALILALKNTPRSKGGGGYPGVKVRVSGHLPDRSQSPYNLTGTLPRVSRFADRLPSSQDFFFFLPNIPKSKRERDIKGITSEKFLSCPHKTGAGLGLRVSILENPDINVF